MTNLKYSRLVEFNNAAYEYLNQNPDERSETTFALNKLLKFYKKKIEKIVGDWQEEQNDASEEIRVKYCEREKDKDGKPTGIFLEKTYGEGKDMVKSKVFTGENEILANKEIKAKAKELHEKYMNMEIDEVRTHFVKVPPNMNINLVEIFSGFIYEEVPEDKLLELYLGQKKLEPVNGKA